MSKLKKCPTCEKELDKSATVCPNCGKKLKPKPLGCFSAILITVISLVLINNFADYALEPSADEKRVSQNELFESLLTGTPSKISPSGELKEMFSYGSTNTDIQRENKEEEIKGSLVEWNLQVQEVTKKGENEYEIQTLSNVQASVFARVTTRNKEEVDYIESLTTKNKVRVRGIIEGTFMRAIVLDPAIIIK